MGGLPWMQFIFLTLILFWLSIWEGGLISIHRPVLVKKPLPLAQDV
jgi:hypothetical protein